MIPLTDVLALVCYSDLEEQEDLKFMLSARQRTLVADEVNNQILS